MRLFEVTTPEDLEACFAIRVAVFVDEQHVPAEEELDAKDHDPATVHLAIADEQGIIGTARILPDEPGKCHIGRVALTKASRGTGAGKKLMAFAAQRALEHCGSEGDEGRDVTIDLSAQERVIPFYEACGYQLIEGERFLDGGIWHRSMRLVVRGVGGSR